MTVPLIFDELGLELTEGEIEEGAGRKVTQMIEGTVFSIIAGVTNETMESVREKAEDPDPVVWITHSAAVKMFDGCMQYLQEQNQSTVCT